MMEAEHDQANENYAYSIDQSKCIACGACTSLAPVNMRMEPGFSTIHTQPTSKAQRADMTAAFYNCPAAAVRRTLTAR